MTLTDELIQYSKDCIADTRRVCQKHRWACERFLNDLKKSRTKDFPYIFDEEKALRFFEWAALHKHTKGVLAGEPIEFTPIQRFIFAWDINCYHSIVDIQPYCNLALFVSLHRFCYFPLRSVIHLLTSLMSLLTLLRDVSRSPSVTSSIFAIFRVS